MTGVPWRLLVLDRDPADPKWLFVIVSNVSDVRPAVLDAAGRFQDWKQVTDWVRSQVTGQPSLDPCKTAWPGT
jgi:hypothetical protein